MSLKKMKEKWLSILLFMGMSIALLVILLEIGLFHPNVSRVTEQAQGTVRLALVNEDLGATFNGNEYQLGREFVYLINQDQVNEWQTTSRNIAESGLASGAFYGMIILPQNFSENLLTLQSFRPEQAQIIYEVRAGQSEMVNVAIRDRVGEILSDFQERVTQMYFSSILGNLFEAQLTVQTMVSDEREDTLQLQNNVYSPFQDVPDNLSMLLGDTEFLEENLLSEQEIVWSQQEEIFQTRLQESFTSAGESFTDQLTALDNFLIFQEEIGRTNQANAQSVLDRQAQSDLETYRQFFDLLYQTSREQVGAMTIEEINELEMSELDTTHLEDFVSHIGHFSQLQSERSAYIEGNLETVDELGSNLVEMRNRIAEHFFGDPSLTPETATPQHRRDALVGHINNELSREIHLHDDYFDMIDEGISSIHVENLTSVVHWFYERNMITNQQKRNYEKTFAILKKYAKDEGITFNTDNHFSFIEVDSSAEIPPKSFSQNVSFPLVEGENIINITSDLANAITIGNKDELEEQLNRQLAHVTEGGGTLHIHMESDTIHIQMEIADVYEEDQTTPIPVTSYTKEVQVNIELIWNLAEMNIYQSGEITNGVTFTLIRNGDTQKWSTNQLSVFVDLYGELETAFVHDFPKVLSQLQTADRTVQQIMTIYGDPEQLGLSLAPFYQAVVSSSYSISDLATNQSIFQKYGNITEEDRNQLIVDGIGDFFTEQGNQLFQQVDQAHAELNNFFTVHTESGEPISLKEMFKKITNTDKLVQKTTLLREWHYQAQAAQANWLQNWHRETESSLVSDIADWRKNAETNVSESFGQWENTEQFVLALRELTSGYTNMSNQALYLHTDSGDLLLESVRLLMDLSQEQLFMAGEGLERLTDVDGSFEQVITQTNQAVENAEGILSDMNTVVSTAVERVGENQLYADNFVTVMENARVGGADNREVLSFLASPLELSGSVQVAERMTMVPYFLTIISAILTLTVGYSVSFLDKEREWQEKDKVIAPTRMWLNRPITMKTIGIATLVSIFLSILSQRAAPNVHLFMWFSYIFFILTTSILFMAFLVRQVPKLSLSLFGIVMGSYLLLTPLLDTEIQSGSLIYWFFRFSPLQNIEHGFGVLMNNGQIGLGNYLLLIVLLLIGTGLNFLVKRKTVEV